MIDGRCSLHLAAQMGMVKVVKALLEKSEKNKIEKGPDENDAKVENVKDKDVDMEDQKDEVRVLISFRNACHVRQTNKKYR